MGEKYNPKLGGLTLWIQRAPQDSALGHGYPKAAFAGLKIVSTLTSSKREIFEWPLMSFIKYISNLNPKHNAGYVHICILLLGEDKSSPEDRAFPVERAQENPMMMLDSSELDNVQTFIGFCTANCRAPRSYPGPRNA